MFERQVALRAFSRAWAKTGKRIAAKMAMMAITTSSSIKVNALRLLNVASNPRENGMMADSFGPARGIPAASDRACDAEKLTTETRREKQRTTKTQRHNGEGNTINDYRVAVPFFFLCALRVFVGRIPF